MTKLPYRPCVGAALFNGAGQVFIARRLGSMADDAWQMPQGGIDDGEDPAIAALRELQEETGITQAAIIGEHPDWLTYDLPTHLIGVALRGKYRGQRQRWFALRFTGTDADIRLDHDGHPEFGAWRWAGLNELTSVVVGFKRPIYSVLARSFARFTVPAG